MTSDLAGSSPTSLKSRLTTLETLRPLRMLREISILNPPWTDTNLTMGTFALAMTTTSVPIPEEVRSADIAYKIERCWFFAIGIEEDITTRSISLTVEWEGGEMCEIGPSFRCSSLRDVAEHSPSR